LGSSALQELNDWSASGAKPSNPSVFPDALAGFVQGFSTLMIAYAIVSVLVGFVVLILGNKADKEKVSASS
jgi:hypothetical protein